MESTSTNKKKVVVIGKLPPPIMGPAMATKIILESSLKDIYDLVHFDITINKEIATQGELSVKKVFSSIALYVSYYRLLKMERPDLVIMSSFSQSVIGFFKDIPYLIFPKWFGIKVVGQLRGSNFKNILAGTNSFFAWIIKNVLGKVDGVIVLGNNLRYIFKGIVDNDKLFVVPNGANYSLEASSNENTGKVNILYLANLYESKGVDKVVDAAIELNDDRCNFTLAGGWRSDEEFKRNLLLKIEQSNANINLQPPVSGKAKFKLFANADIFVFPPQKPEGHPWVLVEAMAYGLPIISTDQGAIVESVIEGENGFIVDTGGHEQIVEKIRLLLDDQELMGKMGSQSRKYYLQKFTEEKMVENFSTVIDTVISK